MRAALVAVVALAAAGCFKPDLGDGNVVCGSGGACPPGYGCDTSTNRCVRAGADLAAGGSGGSGGGTGDDMSSTDMAMSSACGTDGTRLCIDAARSGVCMGGSAMVDRECPPGSSCDSATGHCAPPVGSSGCMTSKDCMGGNVCVLYSVNGALLGFCTMPPSGATGGAGATCAAAGYDQTCKTGICASEVTMPTTRACLYQCKTQGDCGGGGLVCTAVVGVPSAIEGTATGGLKFCTQ